MLGTVSTTHYYTALYDGYTLGTLTYSEANNRWTYTAGTPINNGTLTIQKNGTNIQTFTANQSSNATANITVPTQFSDLTGTIGTSQIADSAVTAAKITPSVLAFQPGDVIDYRWLNIYSPGRERTNNGVKTIETQVVLAKPIASSVTSISFAAESYNEAFDERGIVYSYNNPSSSQLTFDCSTLWSGAVKNIIRVVITAKDSGTTLNNNHSCIVNLSGRFTLS